MGLMEWGFVGMFFLAGVGVFYKGIKYLQLKSMVENIPTSKAQSIAMGLVELQGLAESHQGTIIAPRSQEQCVYYRYLVEEYRHGRKSSSWQTVMDQKQGVPFLLDDGTGKVVVDPNGAEIELERDGYWPVGNMRYSEWKLKPGEQCYVMGYAGDNPDVAEGSAETRYGDVMVRADKSCPFFYISDKQEGKLKSGLAWKSAGALFFGALSMLGSAGAMLFWLTGSSL